MNSRKLGDHYVFWPKTTQGIKWCLPFPFFHFQA